ncbi:hypothetical protein RCL_jg11798.t1 [Rhizophagus clarus]|uniref:Uncharacterized protein n=1 Tax=Rhizophagus clarus TaxID=94130 RepID=A0A8H3MEG6_9GLOM|nr:hypothetical protein RCL_jg11798.t1 [Rhizophagus clarus]
MTRSSHHKRVESSEFLQLWKEDDGLPLPFAIYFLYLDYEKDYDNDYIIFAIYSLVREIQNKSLKDQYLSIRGKSSSLAPAS